MNKCIHLLFLFFFCLCLSAKAQEICDNGIDDDGDGLIDLNDTADCNCDDVIATSLIPNPSFEEMTCCPTANEQLSCAVDWAQASSPTTDYVHTCGGYLGNTSIPAFAPLPFADGEGGVGFRDGQMNVGPQYKEYVGACLTEVMEVGVTYRLDFFVGFQDNKPGSMDFDIAIFASANCADLPFGGGSNLFGCPANSPEFVELGEQYVSGSNEWVNVVFEFVADQSYEDIVIGPSCFLNDNYLQDPYFYIDRLTLAELSDFGIPPVTTNGAICENDLILSVAEDPENTYQWYQDGIAIVGETSATLELTSTDNTAGSYQVFINSPGGCGVSEIYPLQIPPYYETLTVTICEDEHYIFGTDTLTVNGYYEDLLVASDGCDSIVQLELEVLGGEYLVFADTICEGVPYFFNGAVLLEGGVFDTTLVSSLGCDSLVRLELYEIDLGIGISLPGAISLKLGEQINLSPNYYDQQFTNFLWSDAEGNVLSETLQVLGYQPVFSTLVYLEASNEYGCMVLDSIQITVLPNHNIFVPNAFSPDGDGVNDYFRFYPAGAVAVVHNFSVFSRWGGLIFRNEKIVNFESYEGWDGLQKGEEAQVGVYTYLLEVEYLDGVRELLSGDVTLLR